MNGLAWLLDGSKKGLDGLPDRLRQLQEEALAGYLPGVQGRLTQARLAELAYVSPQTVSAWMQRISHPKPSHLRQLARGLGVDPEWLGYGETLSRSSLEILIATAERYAPPALLLRPPPESSVTDAIVVWASRTFIQKTGHSEDWLRGRAFHELLPQEGRRNPLLQKLSWLSLLGERPFKQFSHYGLIQTADGDLLSVVYSAASLIFNGRHLILFIGESVEEVGKNEALIHR